MDFFLTTCQLNSFAAMWGNQVYLAGIVLGVDIGVVGLPCRGFAFGEESNPLAIWRPFGCGIVTGLCQLDQRGAISVEPKISAENLLVPISAFSGDDNRRAIRRHFNRWKADGVEKVIESEHGLALRENEECRNQHNGHNQDKLFDWHRVPGEKKVYTTRDSWEASL